MYLADYHLHASCSPDGILTIPQIARQEGLEAHARSALVRSET